MKKIIYLLAAVFISLNSFGQKNISTQSNGGGDEILKSWHGIEVLYSPSPKTLDTIFGRYEILMNPGDSVVLRAFDHYADEFGTTIYYYPVFWFLDSVLITPQSVDTITVKQFGTIGFNSTTSYIATHITLLDASGITGLSEIPSSNLLQIYPTLSTGIFKIKNDAQHRIKKITVSDDAGRIVYLSSTDLSEINLSNLLYGIYFYAVEDETMKVYRGKIAKN